MLPSDVWAIVLDGIVEGKIDKLILTNICLACHELQNLCQPLLFRTLRLNASKSGPRAEGIGELFKQRPESRRWPKEVILQLGIGGRSKTPAADAIAAIFTQMYNLSKVTVQFSTITAQVYHHLYCLPNLHSLNCLDVRFHDPPLEPIRPAGSLNLSDLCIVSAVQSDFGWPLLVNLAFSNRLSSMTLGTAVFTSYVLRVVLEDSVDFPVLRSISLPELMGEDLDLFFRFLLLIPELRTLDMGWDAPKYEPIHILDNTAHLTPNLCSFKGPLWLANHMVPGRPVDDICVALFDEEGRLSSLSLEVLSTLKASTVPIRSLSIPRCAAPLGDALDMIGQAIPRIRRLKIIPNIVNRQEHKAWLQGHLVGGLLHLQYLEMLYIAPFGGDDIDDELARDLLRGLDSVHSNLKIINFGLYQRYILKLNLGWVIEPRASI